MTGCLQVKNNKYYAVLDERDPSGKRKRRWVCTDLPERGNKRRAQEFLNQLIAEAESEAMAAQEHCTAPS